MRVLVQYHLWNLVIYYLEKSLYSNRAISVTCEFWRRKKKKFFLHYNSLNYFFLSFVSSFVVTNKKSFKYFSVSHVHMDPEGTTESLKGSSTNKCLFNLRTLHISMWESTYLKLGLGGYTSNKGGEPPWGILNTQTQMSHVQILQIILNMWNPDC